MRTPPPTPVMPMRTPTTNPARILAAITGIMINSPLLSSPVDADEAFALEMKNNLLRRFARRQLARINGDFGILRSLIRIGDSRELLQNARACLGIKSLAVALLAHFHRSRNVHQDESTMRFDQ